MVTLRTASELGAMREAGKITGGALAEVAKHIAPGVSTHELDKIINAYITKHKATPSFLGYGGFPASACISINNEVIHGIPTKTRLLQEGDIVSVDVGAFYKGWHGDSARTFAVGTISEKAQALLDITKLSLEKAIAVAYPGNRLGDIGHAVQSTVEEKGFSVVKEYVGHGVGKNLHEAPEVPNYGAAGHGLRLMPGMVIAIEPMINCGSAAVKVLADDWTVVTVDGSLSAHFEHTVAITKNGPVIMTLPE